LSRKRLFLAWAPAAFWLVVIAFESTSIFTGERTSIWTHRLLALFFDHVSWKLVEFVNHVLRKTGHFLGYATLSWFLFRGWMGTLQWQREQFLLKLGRTTSPAPRWRFRAAVLAVLVTIAVAALDEFHQSFLGGRTGVVRDVILDTMGGIFAQTLLLLYWTRPTKPSAGAKRSSELEVATAK
jgi:VanZ family protein